MGLFTRSPGLIRSLPLMPEWYLVVGALQGPWWPVAVVIIITSLMAVIYVGRVLERIWLGDVVAREDGAAPTAQRVGITSSAIICS